MKKKIAALGSLQMGEDTGYIAQVAVLRTQIDKLDQEIESLMDKISSANSTVMEYINERIVVLDVKKKKLYDEIMSMLGK